MLIKADGPDNLGYPPDNLGHPKIAEEPRMVVIADAIRATKLLAIHHCGHDT